MKVTWTGPVSSSGASSALRHFVAWVKGPGPAGRTLRVDSQPSGLWIARVDSKVLGAGFETPALAQTACEREADQL